MDSWPDVPPTLRPGPRIAVLTARGGVRVGYGGGEVTFWVNHVYYFADGRLTVIPMSVGPSPYRTWLLQLVNERRLF